MNLKYMVKINRSAKEQQAFITLVAEAVNKVLEK